jgi:hypothetical protein
VRSQVDVNLAKQGLSRRNIGKNLVNHAHVKNHAAGWGGGSQRDFVPVSWAYLSAVVFVFLGLVSIRGLVAAWVSLKES